MNLTRPLTSVAFVSLCIFTAFASRGGTKQLGCGQTVNQLIIAGENASSMLPGAFSERCFGSSRKIFLAALHERPNNVARDGMEFVVAHELHSGVQYLRSGVPRLADRELNAALADYESAHVEENYETSRVPNRYLSLFVEKNFRQGFKVYAKLYTDGEMSTDVSLNDSHYYDILTSALRAASKNHFSQATMYLERCIALQPSATDSTFFLGVVDAAENQQFAARDKFLTSIDRMRVLDNSAPHYGTRYAVEGAYLLLSWRY